MGERDWVAVSEEEGTEAGWGRDGKGVGVVALLSTLITFVSVDIQLESLLTHRDYTLHF